MTQAGRNSVPSRKTGLAAVCCGLLAVSLIIGVAVTGVVSLGMRAIYPAPAESVAKLKYLDEQEKAMEGARSAGGTLSEGHQLIFERASEKIAAERKDALALQSTWVAITTAILLALGLLIAGASFVLVRRVPVVSNGLLLGGLLTMWYGAVWSLTKTISVTSYAALAVAVVMSVAVVYVRFFWARDVHETATAE